jgi:hypothetical protein
LAIGDNQGSKSAKTIESFVAVLFGSVLVDWGTREFGISSGNLLSLPNKFLKKISIVLGKQQVLGLLNHLAKIINQLFTLCRKLA